MATRPPRASSHTRGKVEKYAAVWFEEVWTTERANEATTAAPSTIARRRRKDERNDRPATTRKMVG